MLTFTRYLQNADVDIQWAADYAEPGYSAPERGILFADWNPHTFDNPTKAERTMPRIAALAEHYRYEIEWSDEWTTCDNCYRAIRTQPDCYSWQPSYWFDEDR